MRILIFNWKDLKHPGAGGAEVFTHEVAKRWVEGGHEVTLFSAVVKGQARKDEQDGVEIIRRGGRFGVYRRARRYYEREGKGRFDLILDVVNTRPFMTPKFVKDTPIAALIFQVCREIWWYEFPIPIAALGRFFLEPKWLRLYRNVRTITISKSSRESLHKYGLRDVFVVPVGVSPPGSISTNVKESVPTLIFVGRLARNKRPHHAIAAFQMVRRSFPEAKLWIVGSGPMEEKLRRTTDSSVIFFGQVAETERNELLSRAWLLLVTSVREGWGLVVSEAASARTPAVGYQVAGLSDAIIHNQTGWLVEPKTQELAMSVNQLLLDHDKRTRLGSNALLWVRSFSWDRTANSLLQFAAGPSFGEM